MAIESISRLTSARGSVQVEDDWIDATLRINDPEGAAFLRLKDDDGRLEASETAMRVGLRALASADHAYTERLLDERLASVTEALGRAADASLARVSNAFEERWRKHIDEELATRLDGHRKALDERLASVFADGSDASVQQTVRKFLTEYQLMITKEIGEDRTRLRRELADLINGAGNPDHPLAKLTSQMTEIRAEIGAVLSVAQAVAAGHQLRNSTAVAGLAYQDEVYAAIVALLTGSDDEPELKGRQPGATGGAEGDIVITVDPRLTSGKTARVAIEVTKQTKGLSLARVKASLKKSMDDRDAQAALLVVRDPAVAGGQRLQFVNGLGVIAVYEPEDPEEFRALPLLVALKHAKAVAVRATNPLRSLRDLERIERASERVKEAIAAVEVIVGSQTKITKSAEATSLAARELRRVVLDAIQEIDAAIG